MMIDTYIWKGNKLSLAELSQAEPRSHSDKSTTSTSTSTTNAAAAAVSIFLFSFNPVDVSLKIRDDLARKIRISMLLINLNGAHLIPSIHIGRSMAGWIDRYR